MTIFESELNAEFYYHGTGKEYFNAQMKKHGRYQHDSIKGADTALFVGRDKTASENYAKDRSARSALRDSPLPLIIKGKMIRKRIREHHTIPDLVIDYLNKNEFTAIEVK